MIDDPAISAAYHEAGHAVIAAKLGLLVRKVEIAEDGTGNTRTAILSRIADTAIGIEREICVSMAGAASEILFLGASDSAACATDRANQAALAEQLPPSVQRHWQVRLWARTRFLVRHHRTAIEQLALLLLDAPTTKGDQNVVRVISPRFQGRHVY